MYGTKKSMSKKNKKISLAESGLLYVAILDKSGLPVYSKNYTSNHDQEINLLGLGLLSAIQSLANTAFKTEIHSIEFGNQKLIFFEERQFHWKIALAFDPAKVKGISIHKLEPVFLQIAEDIRKVKHIPIAYTSKDNKDFVENLAIFASKMKKEYSSHLSFVVTNRSYVPIIS